jgi:exonuclease SbcC
MSENDNHYFIDDMIQELNTLGQQLKCIILVSHQDDFATAFPNRYSFKLVDKASFVTLVGDE